MKREDRNHTRMTAPEMSTGGVWLNDEDSDKKEAGSGAVLERMLEIFSPAPEPPLKINPSSRYQLRMEFMVSSTARMKHAE